MSLPPCPQSLKGIQHYLKTASEHEQRDIVVAYWCRLYALQTALKIDKKSEDARKLLAGLMDWLEQTKKTMTNNEAITNDVAAQAHLENYALKLFTWADSQDRAGVFNKNVVKAFYTAGMLMDVLTTFGEQTDEIARNSKYAKWKAAYIHNCLKNGETPIPGPMGAENDDELNNFNVNLGSDGGADIGFNVPNSSIEGASNLAPPPSRPDTFPSEVARPPPVFTPPAAPAPAVTPTNPYHPTEEPALNSNIKADPAVISKAQKYCKFAGSALNYDDIPEAINNLRKALRLLETGQDV